MTALLDHVWQSSAVLAVIGLLTLLFSNNGARIRHALWTAASLKFLVPFAGVAALGRYAASLLPSPPAAPPVLETFQRAAQPFSRSTDLVSPAATPSHSMSLTSVVWFAWVAGFIVICSVWLTRWWKLRAVVRAARESDIAAATTVMLSPTLMEPGVIGIIRPVLLLPEGITTVLSPDELQSVLAHEACHLRRRDNLTAALHMIVEALFWFWPPVWWLGARLIAERERACDEAVVAAGSDPQVYAESIVKVCKFNVASPLACAAGVSGADLKQRVEEIMRNTVIARLNIPKKALLAFCAAAVVALPFALGLLKFPAALADKSAPHAGTEAALRRQIDGWENKQPVTSDMAPGLVKATEEQHAAIQKLFDGFGALKSITFYGNDSGNDVYRVEFDHASSVWTIGPLSDGKISTLFISPAFKRDGNAPSPGTQASLRRYIESLERGQPNYDEMTPALADAVRHQLPDILALIKAWGQLESIVFKGTGPGGMDVYDVTFEHGAAEWSIGPLDSDGKVVGRGFRPASSAVNASAVYTAPPAHTEIVSGLAQHPGTEASLRRYIESLERGQPNYDEMTAPQADVVRQQLPDILSMMKPWGALKSIAFRGVAPNGMDVYDVTFDHATAEWEIAPLDADGKVVRRGFHPTSDVAP